MLSHVFLFYFYTFYKFTRVTLRLSARQLKPENVRKQKQCGLKCCDRFLTMGEGQCYGNTI